MGLLRIAVAIVLAISLNLAAAQGPATAPTTAPSTAPAGGAAMPMAPRAADSIVARWLAKKVHKSRLLDDMENINKWDLLGGGDGAGEMGLTQERAIDGKSSLRFISRTAGRTVSRSGNPTGHMELYRKFPGEDWTAWNRLSFWVWPHAPGHNTVSLSVGLGYGSHHVTLEQDKWNHVVWEIADVPRQGVDRLSFHYTLNGRPAGAAEAAQFDMDHLELQAVDADGIEGWGVAPGQIAFSHSGYPTGGTKLAIADDSAGGRFELLDAAGKVVLDKTIRRVDTGVGRFGVMDFSEQQAEGVYRLRAGDCQSREFRIAADVWDRTLWKAINFFFVQRCGFAVPGVHDVCHADWQARHGGQTIVINGGWHDAGDMAQGPVNSGEADFAMFDVVRDFRRRGRGGPLTDRLLEEARWGLDRILNTSFHDGYRVQWAEHRFWSNNKIGDVDDVFTEGHQDAWGSFLCSAAEAVAANVLKPTDPALAAKALAMAREDWGFATAQFDKLKPADLPVETLGTALLAAIELYRATGEQAFADQARRWARVVLDSQQAEVPAGMTSPMAGWFYTNANRRERLWYYHRAHDHAPVLALIRLCEMLPQDKDWMDWYAGVTLWSQYFQKPLAGFSGPYGLLSNSAWRLDEWDGRSSREVPDFRALTQAGAGVGAGWFVRTFPAHPGAYGYQGNDGTILTAAKALAAAAHFRGDLQAAEIAQQQLYWIVGRNPFCQSLMYGEGYDWPPMYSPRSGNIVGAIPVGIFNSGTRDVPYWPATTTCCYKEIWVHPVGRWIWLMGDLAGEPAVHVTAPGQTAVTFRQVSAAGAAGVAEIPARTARLDAAGQCRLSLPAGVYEVAAGAARRTVSLLPAGSYELDLRPERAVDLRVEQATTDDGQVTITLTAAGSGKHSFVLRTHNLQIAQAEQTVELAPDRPTKVTWQGKVPAVAVPWVALIVPDGDMASRLETTALVPRKQP